MYGLKWNLVPLRLSIIFVFLIGLVLARREMNVVIPLPEIGSINLENLNIFFIELLDLNKEYCINFLMHFGLIAKNVNCCGNFMTLTKKASVTDGYIFYCNKCHKYASIRRGSFFERSHLSFGQVLKLIYFYSNNIYNQDLLIKEMKLSSKTIVDWKNFIRDVYCNHFIRNSSKIGAAGMIVQIDESLICKRKYGVGRILANQEQWIVGGIDEIGEVFMEITTVRNQSVLEEIISRNVESGSIIWSDCWGGYRNLDSIGYFHEVVNHKNEFVSSTGVHTNRIESTWGAVKRKLNPIRNKKPNLITGYLADYMFKKNSKDLFLVKPLTK